jgi:hypothetical protein
VLFCNRVEVEAAFAVGWCGVLKNFPGAAEVDYYGAVGDYEGDWDFAGGGWRERGGGASGLRLSGLAAFLCAPGKGKRCCAAEKC